MEHQRLEDKYSQEAEGAKEGMLKLQATCQESERQLNGGWAAGGGWYSYPGGWAAGEGWYSYPDWGAVYGRVGTHTLTIDGGVLSMGGLVLIP